jgi:hypothetical protein
MSLQENRFRGLVSLALASILTLAAAGTVLGKCTHDPEAECPAGMVATFDPGGTLTAGSTRTVGLWVHDGEVPYVAEAVTIVFSRVADGTVIRVAASPSDLAGRYVASVELPAGGTWSMAAEVQGTDFAGALPLDAIQVSPPVVTPGDPGPSAAPIPLTPWLGLAVLAAVAAAMGGALTVARRRQATATG